MYGLSGIIFSLISETKPELRYGSYNIHMEVRCLSYLSEHNLPKLLTGMKIVVRKAIMSIDAEISYYRHIIKLLQNSRVFNHFSLKYF